MAKFIAVADVRTLPPGSKKCLLAQNVPLVLFNVEGTIHALLNICPHAGLPFGEGEWHNHTVTCPFHGYTFDVTSGKNVDFEGDAPATVLAVKCENDQIHVDIEPLVSK